MPINMEDLGRCIRAVEEARARPVVRIYLNPDDWKDVKATKDIVSGRSDIPSNSAFGVPIILSSALGRGQYVMEYDTLAGPQLVGWSKQ